MGRRTGGTDGNAYNRGCLCEVSIGSGETHIKRGYCNGRVRVRIPWAAQGAAGKGTLEVDIEEAQIRQLQYTRDMQLLQQTRSLLSRVSEKDLR